MPKSKDANVPADEVDVDPSLTPAAAETDPQAADAEERRIDADAGLSIAAEQQGGAALADIGKRRASDLFRE